MGESGLQTGSKTTLGETEPFLLSNKVFVLLKVKKNAIDLFPKFKISTSFKNRGVNLMLCRFEDYLSFEVGLKV